jgi:monofunctional biosynthetic peptidoglycan transglycosylase
MKKFFKKFLKFFKWAVIIFFSLSIFSVILFRFANPPITPLMIMRYIEHDKKEGERKFLREWVGMDQISPNMVLAAIAGEDNKFPDHFGIDFEAIQNARKLNKYSSIKHGGSTITQQTAKNLFLTPSRTFIRKGFELYFTFLIELIWSKKRIMEVYLNIVEMGDGIYGVEAASEYYYHKPASKLSRGEAALLAATLPSPRKRNPARPNSYLYYYQERVLGIMNQIGKVEL